MSKSCMTSLVTLPVRGMKNGQALQDWVSQVQGQASNLPSLSTLHPTWQAATWTRVHTWFTASLEIPFCELTDVLP